MKGLTIANNVAEEVSLKTEATLHFETMHAITYNRVKSMIQILHTPHCYSSKVAGIANILPLPIGIGTHGMMQHLQDWQPEEFKHLKSIAVLMGIKIGFNQWGYFNFSAIDHTDSLNDPNYDKNTRLIIKKAQKLMCASPNVIQFLTKEETIFRVRLQDAIDSRQPFTFTPIGDR